MIIPPIDWSQSINPTPVPHGTPRCKWIKSFELAQFNISQVHTEELGGFIYFNLDPNALSLRDLFPGAGFWQKNARNRQALLKLERSVVRSDLVARLANWVQ